MVLPLTRFGLGVLLCPKREERIIGHLGCGRNLERTESLACRPTRNPQVVLLAFSQKQNHPAISELAPESWTGLILGD